MSDKNVCFIHNREINSGLHICLIICFFLYEIIFKQKFLIFLYEPFLFPQFCVNVVLQKTLYKLHKF